MTQDASRRAADALARKAVTQLVALFKAEGVDVQAVWVFGSRASGRARADSDVDLAVLLPERPGAELWEWQDRIAGAAGVDVDLVDLRSAPPALAWEVVTQGVIVVEVDEPAVEHFVRHARFAAEDDARRNRWAVEARLGRPVGTPR